MGRESFSRNALKALTLFVVSLSFGLVARAQSSPAPGWTMLDQYVRASKEPCGQRDEAVRLGRKLVALYAREDQKHDVADYIMKTFPAMEEQEKICKEENSLLNLLEKYKEALKAACGNRAEAVGLGKKLLELHGEDKLNAATIDHVKKDVLKLEEADRICIRNNNFDRSYRNKDWNTLFAIGRQVVYEEGRNGLALDVAITLAASGHRLTAYEEDNSFNIETVYLAKLALEMIADGVATKGCWGAFDCYKSKEKALAWLNYIIGYISYFRLDGGKKAIPYFYEATRHEAEFKNDAFVYHAVAIHYFDQDAALASRLTVNEFIANFSIVAVPDSTGEYETAEDRAKREELARLYKNLVNLHNLAYGLAPDEKAVDLGDYIQKLIGRPLIDSSADVKKKTETRAEF